MITVSQNEVSATVVKACRGVNIDWGLAHDAGYLAQMLAGGDNPFLGSLLRVLEASDGKSLSPLEMALATQTLYAPFCGLAFAEWITASGKAWQGKVIAPRYLLAALNIITSHQSDLCFVIKGDEGFDAFVEKGATKGSGSLSDQHMAITMVQEDDQKPDGEMMIYPCQIGQAVSLSSDCWDRLMGYAYRTYVPETEHSRAAGAGAGDIDNE